MIFIKKFTKIRFVQYKYKKNIDEKFSKNLKFKNKTV